jgi:hypothetical protein
MHEWAVRPTALLVSTRYAAALATRAGGIETTKAGLEAQAYGQCNREHTAL